MQKLSYLLLVLDAAKLLAQLGLEVGERHVGVFQPDPGDVDDCVEDGSREGGFGTLLPLRWVRVPFLDEARGDDGR